jgi:hypothetical protein
MVYQEEVVDLVSDPSEAEERHEGDDEVGDGLVAANVAQELDRAQHRFGRDGDLLADLKRVKKIHKVGGLDLSRHRKSQSRDRENLDSFKKLVSMIEISRFCLDTTFQSEKS